MSLRRYYDIHLRGVTVKILPPNVISVPLLCRPSAPVPDNVLDLVRTRFETKL